jgi:hypothetical protein
MVIDFKRIILYILYTSGLMILLTIISKVDFHFWTAAQETYRVLHWKITSGLLYSFLGIYLGFPKLVNQLRKTGYWRVNVNKIIFIAFPMVYVSFYGYLPFAIPEFMIQSDTVFHVAPVIAGYIFIDSFKR